MDKINKYEGCNGSTHKMPRWQIKLKDQPEFKDIMAGGFVKWVDHRPVVAPSRLLVRGDNGKEMVVHGICHPLYKGKGEREGYMYMWPCEKEKDYSKDMDKEFAEKFPSGTKLTFWTSELEFHRLMTKWSIWELESYERMFELCDFDTVEDFWAYWKQIGKPSQVFTQDRGRGGAGKVKMLNRGTIDAFCMFRKGVEPKSEDPENSNGGALKFRATCDRNPNTKLYMDFVWESTVLAVIGQALTDDPELITGCRIADKAKQRQFLLEVWLRDADERKYASVQKKLRDYLQDALAEAQIEVCAAEGGRCKALGVRA